MKNKDLKEFRQNKGLSQSAFADVLGISQPAISGAESKPEELVSKRIFSLFQEKFPADQDTNDNDPTIDLNFKISMKKSQMDMMQGKKAVVDLTPFFTVL